MDNSLPADMLVDTQAVLERLVSGKPLDSEVARRIHERAERIRQDIYQKQGLLDIGVPAIRSLRDGA